MPKLVKLKIEAYEDPECNVTKKGEIDAMINPASYQRTYNPKYELQGELGSPDATLTFTGIGENDLNLSFVVDGTGIVPLPSGFSNADDYIDKFMDLVYGFQGDIHRPYYLLVTWGKLTFTGICANATVKYSLFTPDGKALRATIDVTLTESKDYKTKAKEAKKKSSDLTHERKAQAGDNLPLMTYRIYRDPSYYLQVARLNGLTSCWAIKPGDKLKFPSVKK
jgi:nucleoid-associated protein YgaU